MTAPTDWTSYAPLDASYGRRLRASAADVLEGLAQHRAWRYLAVEHVKNSYRRTVLGPWWLTAQTLLFVLGVGYVFSRLNGQPVKVFLPYVTTGYLTFALLAGITRACANVFVSQAGLIKSTRQPLTSLVLRAVAIETILFAHNVIIVAGFFAVRLIDPSPWLILAPLAVLVILINGVALGLWLGPLVARFRDLAPAVESVLSLLVFFTPIFYRASIFKGMQRLVVAWNPYTYFVDLFRDCILGTTPQLSTVVGSAVFTVANVVVAILLFAKTRSRLPYWVS